MEATPYQTARGRRQAVAVQFSVFLANRIGQLRDLLLLFKQHDIDILGLSVVDSTDWAVIRLVPGEADAARTLLTAQAMPFTESQVLLIELDRGDALPQLCGCLVAAEVSIHFAYPLAWRSNNKAVMVLHVDDEITAAKVLADHGFTLADGADLTE